MKKRTLRNLWTRLPLLLVTGLPGLSKLLLFSLIQFAYGANSLGEISNDISISTLMIYFTSVGWSSLLMVRVASSSTSMEIYSNFIGILRYSIICCCSILPISYLLYHLDIVINLQFTFFYLVGMSIYQLSRRLFIARKKYNTCLLIDFFYLTTTLTLISINSYLSSMPLWMAIILPLLVIIAGAVVCLLPKLSTLKTPPLTNSDLKKGFEFGLSNLVSGGIILLLPPVTTHIAGLDYTGFIALITSFLGIALLIPRSLALDNLPDLSREVKSKNWHKVDKRLKDFRRVLNSSLIVIFIFCPTIWLLFRDFLFNEFAGIDSNLTIFIIMCLAIVSSQLSLPEMNFFTATENSRFSLVMNLQFFFLFLFALWPLTKLPLKPQYSIISILSTIAVINIIKFLYLSNKRRKCTA